jgi:hypothetical protein
MTCKIKQGTPSAAANQVTAVLQQQCLRVQYFNAYLLVALLCLLLLCPWTWTSCLLLLLLGHCAVVLWWAEGDGDLLLPVD